MFTGFKANIVELEEDGLELNVVTETNRRLKK